jgi:hypothetical protein
LNARTEVDVLFASHHVDQLGVEFEPANPEARLFTVMRRKGNRDLTTAIEAELDPVEWRRPSADDLIIQAKLT